MSVHVPAGSKVVIEPLVPDNWAVDVGRSLPATPTGERWWRWPTWLTTLDRSGNQLPQGEHRFVLVDQYERNLYPALLDRYVQDGYCWVVLGSLQAGRPSPSLRTRRRPSPTTPCWPGGRASSTTSARSPEAPMPSRSASTGRSTTTPASTTCPDPELSVYRLSGGRCS